MAPENRQIDHEGVIGRRQLVHIAQAACMFLRGVRFRVNMNFRRFRFVLCSMHMWFGQNSVVLDQCALRLNELCYARSDIWDQLNAG